MQVAHLRVAAALERRVEVRDQRLEAQALRLLAADQHAVGAVVGDRRALTDARLQPAARCAEQRIDDAHDLGRARVLAAA